MPNMSLNIEQRLGQKLTNEQQLIWNYLLRRWPNLTFREYVFSGLITGAPLTVYNANILYLGYSLQISDRSTGSSQAAIPVNTFYDETNAPLFMLYNVSSYWDATAAASRYVANEIIVYNIYFSRVAPSIPYNGYYFIGYQITI